MRRRYLPGSLRRMDRADSAPTVAPHMATAAHVHRPKVETFDRDAKLNIDPKGFRRTVDTYTETPWGLYMARPADHPSFCYLESWLLPDLGLRVSKFHFTPQGYREQDHYVDIVEIDRLESSASDPERSSPEESNHGALWRTTDLYLDIVVVTGRETQVLDADELALAIAGGVIEPARGEYAMDRAFTAAIGIASAGHDVDRWLADGGRPVEWLGHTPGAGPADS